jgi:hypothetical protein
MKTKQCQVKEGLKKYFLHQPFSNAANSILQHNTMSCRCSVNQYRTLGAGTGGKSYACAVNFLEYDFNWMITCECAFVCERVYIFQAV